MKRFWIADKKTYCYLGVISKKCKFYPDRDEEKVLAKMASKNGGVFNGSATDLTTGKRDYGLMFPTMKQASEFDNEAFRAKIINSKVYAVEYALDWVEQNAHSNIDVKNLAKKTKKTK